MTIAPTTAISETRVAARMTLAGHVQGIGLRPAVARFAGELALTGFVGNTRGGVEIHVEGAAGAVERFQGNLGSRLPDAAAIDSIHSRYVDPQGFDDFTIAIQPQSEVVDDAEGRLALSTRVPPDVTACSACLAEVEDADNRRQGYGFTSCTNCGPRYSIVEQMPYERAQTSMREFALCGLCKAEYESAADRRFHAQTNACDSCGPQVWLRDCSDRVIARRHDAIRAAAAALREGRIVALRGLGGYQLLVDATSQEAVARLRQRKGRRGKPLAAMTANLAQAAPIAHLDADERQLLACPAGPIVIVKQRGDSRLAASVSNGVQSVGLMLPTTPLHYLLLREAARPLVCTSGNSDGDPLAYESSRAIEQLQSVADVWLEHDRPIRRPIDDSVVRVIAGKTVAVRLARGYAPLSLELSAQEPLIALGGHQKVALALANGAQAVLGPHVGDLNTTAARERFVDQLGELARLYGIDDCLLACDRHPGYFTAQWAEIHRSELVRVQHHHAHIAAGMLQNGWLDRRVLGVSFDGAGYGDDGGVWGGEFVLAQASGFHRVGHLRPFPLAGGDLAAVEPWRVATALVREAVSDEAAMRLPFETAAAQSLLPVLRRPALSPKSTSAGRLFDGVAALILGIERISFEGEAAMLLEAACDPGALGEYEIPITNDMPAHLDWRPLIRQVLQDRAGGAAPGAMAMRFHRGLAGAIVRFCRRYSSLPVVLGGGVFQNRVLAELTAQQFADSRRPLGLPGLIPPNDGGLAAGQLAVASALAEQRRSPRCV